MHVYCREYCPPPKDIYTLIPGTCDYVTYRANETLEV